MRARVIATHGYADVCGQSEGREGVVAGVGGGGGRTDCQLIAIPTERDRPARPRVVIPCAALDGTAHLRPPVLQQLVHTRLAGVPGDRHGVAISGERNRPAAVGLRRLAVQILSQLHPVPLHELVHLHVPRVDSEGAVMALRAASDNRAIRTQRHRVAEIVARECTCSHTHGSLV